jgi:hypothetical protein
MTADKASIHSRVSWLSVSLAANVRDVSGAADMLVSLIEDGFFVDRDFDMISNDALTFCIMKYIGLLVRSLT